MITYFWAVTRQIGHFVVCWTLELLISSVKISAHRVGGGFCCCLGVFPLVFSRLRRGIVVFGFAELSAGGRVSWADGYLLLLFILLAVFSFGTFADRWCVFFYLSVSCVCVLVCFWQTYCCTNYTIQELCHWALTVPVRFSKIQLSAGFVCSLHEINWNNKQRNVTPFNSFPASKSSPCRKYRERGSLDEEPRVRYAESFRGEPPPIIPDICLYLVRRNWSNAAATDTDYKYEYPVDTYAGMTGLLYSSYRDLKMRRETHAFVPGWCVLILFFGGKLGTGTQLMIPTIILFFLPRRVGDANLV